MTTTVRSPADLANITLTFIGFKDRVGNLFDGSMQSKVILDVYAQVRDEMLRKGNWPFASRTIAATLLKSAPTTGYFPPGIWDPATYPPQPWAFSYAYPDDCLEVRAVKPPVLFTPNFAPRPYLFAVANDNGYTPPRRVVCSNVSDAIMTYAGQVTDPTSWPSDFVNAYAAELGKAISASLANLQTTQLAAADAKMQTDQAEMRQG